jgi:hypothetical protein
VGLLAASLLVAVVAGVWVATAGGGEGSAHVMPTSGEASPTGDAFPIGDAHPTDEASPTGAAPTGPAQTPTPGQTGAQVPDVPTNLTASPGDTTVRLCWTTAARADAYVVYHRDVTAGADWYRMPYPIAKPCWTGNQFWNGHIYEFRLRAGNRYGESGFSNVARAAPHGEKPAAPTNLTATAGNATVTLCWTPSALAGGYVMYYRDATAGAAWVRMPYPIEKPCWTGGQFTNGHTYEFTILAGNLNGESGFSNTVTATPHA